MKTARPYASAVALFSLFFRINLKATYLPVSSKTPARRAPTMDKAQGFPKIAVLKFPGLPQLY